MKGGSLASWKILPWYVFLAGVLGVIFISAFTFLIPKIGVASAIILTVAGQLTVAALLDHYALLGVEARPVSWQRVSGLTIVFLGIWQTIR